MISFRNDYSEVAHPRILQSLLDCAYTQNDGYGLDRHSEIAAGYIRTLLGRDAAIHLIPAGTQTNLLAISACLRPFECVICASSGHINVHEAGAIESSGHKVFAIPHEKGKLTAAAVEKAVAIHEDEHMVKPKMVYISQLTELGTLYSKAELTALHEVCRKHRLLLYLDGARLGSALTAKENDLTLADLASLCDLFYIGGTKNGAMIGEALVICNDVLDRDFRYMIKNRGAMLAKGFVTGIQFEVLFEGGENALFFNLARHANAQAEKLVSALQAKGYSFLVEPCGGNMIYPILPISKIETLEQAFGFYRDAKIDEQHSAIRLVTSWATSDEAIESFVKAL